MGGDVALSEVWGGGKGRWKTMAEQDDFVRAGAQAHYNWAKRYDPIFSRRLLQVHQDRADIPIALWLPARLCNHCASSSLPYVYSELFHSPSCRALSVPAGYCLAERQVPTYRTPDFAQADNVCCTRSQCIN